MLKYDINCLAQCLEQIKGSKSGTESITYKFQGDDRLLLTYVTITHIASDASMQLQIARESERSIDMVNDAMKTVKKMYKDGCGKTLKVKEVSTDDLVEVISTTFHSARKVAYYKRFVMFEVG